jgi:hypothetical protein
MEPQAQGFGVDGKTVRFGQRLRGESRAAVKIRIAPKEQELFFQRTVTAIAGRPAD